MRFATILSSAALASVALALPTTEWNGESYGGHGKKHEHEVSPTSPEQAPKAPVEVSPNMPATYNGGNNEVTPTTPEQKPEAPVAKPETPVEVSPTTPEEKPEAPVQASPNTPPTYNGGGNNEVTPATPDMKDFPKKEVSPATPGQYNGGNDCTRNCITDQQAQQGAEIFRQLIQNYTETLALSALTPDFEDYTSSVNIIRNRGNKGPIQVNGVSFTSREDFMNAQGSQPQIPFDTLNVFHGCDSITVRWQTTDSAAGQATKANDIPAPGIGLMQTIPATDNEYGFRIKTLYSEFNSAAWLVNLGVFTPVPDTTSSKRDLPQIAAI